MVDLGISRMVGSLGLVTGGLPASEDVRDIRQGQSLCLAASGKSSQTRQDLQYSLVSPVIRIWIWRIALGYVEAGVWPSTTICAFLKN